MNTFATSKNYAACVHPRAGLIIQNKTRGVRMPPDHPQFAEYVEAFESAIDIYEADALCRALLN
jgi:hypothetical protein